MKRLLEWMRDELLFVLAVALYVWAFAVAPDKALQALAVGGRTFLGILPIIAAVFAALGLFNVWVDKKKIAAVLGKGGGIRAVAIASLAGTILVGPVYVIFPLLKAVREHGARWAVIGAVLAAWAVKVPMVPMEIGMLGLRFSVARIALVALAAIPIGYLLEWVMGIRRPVAAIESDERIVIDE
ncbi:MAG: hypothetical protein Q7W44_07165 [Coriobacteriia bacterium]|nr:hypothetical protein [Coriobacteriia bacterium]